MLASGADLELITLILCKSIFLSKGFFAVFVKSLRPYQHRFLRVIHKKAQYGFGPIGLIGHIGLIGLIGHIGLIGPIGPMWSEPMA